MAGMTKPGLGTQDRAVVLPRTRYDIDVPLRLSVELRGFEPLTPSMRTRCATGLRHSPEIVHHDTCRAPRAISRAVQRPGVSR